MRLRDHLATLPSPQRLAQPSLPTAPTRAAAPVAPPAEALAALGRSDRLAQLRALIEQCERRAPPRTPTPARERPQSLQAWLGEPTATASGPLHRRQRWLEPQHHHGRVHVGLALQANSEVLAQLALDVELRGIDVSRMLVIDTETTGLAGGSGTVPFLIGLGAFDDASFALEQLVLPNFGAERPLLNRLAERLANASCIVSYNGKSFDWPLLRTRFILNRVACPAVPPHLDLLHCARRVFKRRLPNLRLVELERSVLGFYREDDVDGAEIPVRYLNFVRSGDARQLSPILEHNQHDLVALPAILWRLCAHFEQLRPADDARDQLSYAQLALRAGDLERAHLFGASAADSSDTQALQCDALSTCADAARRRGDLSSAAELWRRALEHAPCALSSARLHLRLARVYEHKLKDLEQARVHAGFTAPAEGGEAHERRLLRLSRRMQMGRAPE